MSLRGHGHRESAIALALSGCKAREYRPEKEQEYPPGRGTLVVVHRLSFRTWPTPNTVQLVVQNALEPQQFRNRLSGHPKSILLSPSGGGEDEGEGVNCGAHSPHPYPLLQMGEKKLRKAAVGPLARGDYSRASA
jgi:hypothetical protein